MVIEKFSFQRLPTEVVPENYDIFIRLNLQSFIFEGREIIQIKVVTFIQMCFSNYRLAAIKPYDISKYVYFLFLL